MQRWVVLNYLVHRQKKALTKEPPEGLGLSLALNQFNKWVAGTKAEAKARGANKTPEKVAFIPAEPVAHAAPVIGEDGIVIKKSQITFFELLWSVTTNEQKEQVKRLVADAARQAVLDAAEQAANDIAAMFPNSNNHINVAL